MSALLDLILDTFPANSDVSVPLSSNITITLSGLDYDEVKVMLRAMKDGWLNKAGKRF